MGKKAHLQVLVWFCIKNVLDCRRIWLTLAGKNAMLLKEVCNLLATAWKKHGRKYRCKFLNFSYHRGCYSAFTNSSMMDKGVPSSSGIDIIDGETESDETPPVKKMLRSTHVKISQLVNKMCSQQTCSKLVNKL